MLIVPPSFMCIASVTLNSFALARRLGRGTPFQCDLPPALGSFEGITLAGLLVQIDDDGNAIVGVPSVVQVIAAVGVNDVHIIVVVPVVRPVFWPRVHKTEPKTTILEARIPTVQLHRVAPDAEPVIRTKAQTIPVIWNAVTVIAAALLPVPVLGLPVSCAMLLPHLASLTLLHTLPPL